MIGVAEFVKPSSKFFGGKGGERKGSRRKVILADGSTVKWWNGTWRFSKPRFNTKVATSLQRAAMCKAIDAGTEVVDAEVYTDFNKFMQRMVGVVGSYEFLRIVNFIQGGA